MPEGYNLDADLRAFIGGIIQVEAVKELQELSGSYISLPSAVRKEKAVVNLNKIQE